MLVGMNDAVSKTVAMLVAAVKAQGLVPTVRVGWRGDAMVSVEEDQSRFVGFSHSVRVGRFDVYESGRFQEFNEAGVKIAAFTPELEALRFRRAG
jgi:hypothetical protein